MSNPTDTNQASLFELCKEVAKRTDWLCDEDESDFYFYWEANEGGDFSIRYRNECPYYSKDEYYPLYTSDYLLAKLPNELKRSDDQYGALWGMKNLTQMLDGVWDASYRFEDEMNPPDYKYSCESDTPLKALLKLTIALSEAGELK